MPVEASHVLKTGHFLVGEVGHNLDHGATVAVKTKDLVVNKLTLEEDLLDDDLADNEAADDPLSAHGIFQ